MEYLREEFHSTETALEEALYDYPYNSRVLRELILMAIRKFPEFIYEYLTESSQSINMEELSRLGIVKEYKKFWKQICFLVRKAKMDHTVKQTITLSFKKMRLAANLWELGINIDTICDDILDDSENLLNRNLPLDMLHQPVNSD